MQHGDASDLRAEVLGISGDGAQGLGRRLEQQGVHDRLVLERDGRDRVGDGKDHVKILGLVQQVGLAPLNPRGARQRLARGTVPIPAGVVRDALVGTRVAPLDMAAELRRAARLDRGHDAPLGHRQRGRGPIGVAVAAEDIRYLQWRTIHDVTLRRAAAGEAARGVPRGAGAGRVGSWSRTPWWWPCLIRRGYVTATATSYGLSTICSPSLSSSRTFATR